MDQGVTVLDHVPSDDERLAHDRIVTMTHHIAYGAFRTDPDAPPARMARAGMRHLYGEEPILIRTMGGSVPIAPIIEALDVPAAIVPTVNMDNNQPAPRKFPRGHRHPDVRAAAITVNARCAPRARRR